MGYYSFYRIIKDILYNFKKNKLLVIIAIIILSLFLCNKVFASDNNIYSFTTGGTTYYLNFTNKVGTCNGSTDKFFTNPDIWNYNILIISNGNFIDFLLYNGDLTYKLDTNINRYGFYSDTSSYINVGRSVGASWVWTYPHQLSDFSTLAPNVPFRGYNYSATYNNIMFSSTNIYDENGNIFYKSSLINYPKITNKLEDLQTLNFDTISVSAWDWSNKDLYILFYDRTLMNNQNTEGLYPKKEIKLTKDTSYYIPEISSEENAIYWIANDNTGLNFKVGGKYEIRLAERVPQSTGGGFRGGDLYSYNYLGDSVQFVISEDVSAEKLKELNEQTKANEEKERHDETIGAINNQTQATQDLNNSITDSNVSADVNLPTDTTQNPTENGLNNIFDLIYNGFTQGQAQDIVFPIPFTNKSLKIEPNYLQQVLTNNNAQWVITIIQAFWWYLISRFIIKDISRKIRKIKSGNIEDIQNNNIKEDML